MKSRMTAKLVSVSLVLVLAVVGCSKSGNPPAESGTTKNTLLADGVISFFRQAPAPKTDIGTGTAFGFVPLASLHQGPWLSIDRTAGKIELRDGEKVINSATVSGLNSLQPGLKQVLHKQKAPLWYASDSYYTKRGLQVPAQGDRARYLKGALGEFALFIDKDTPLHCAPVWSAEVGGVKLEEADLSRIYYTLPVGATVEIK